MPSESKISWLASFEAGIARAREALSRLSTPGVLDELGFLVLLGAFSDRLYPAVNTIMTRTRYHVGPRVAQAVLRGVWRDDRLRLTNAVRGRSVRRRRAGAS